MVVHEWCEAGDLIGASEQASVMKGICRRYGGTNEAAFTKVELKEWDYGWAIK